MEFRDLDLQKLRCDYCGNEEDFIIEYIGSVLVHVREEDWEEPHEEINLIVCDSCGKAYFKQFEDK